MSDKNKCISKYAEITKFLREETCVNDNFDPCPEIEDDNVDAAMCLACYITHPGSLASECACGGTGIVSKDKQGG